MTPEEFIRASWQSTPAETPPLSVDELRARSNRFRRRIARRNLVEYVAGAIVLASFGAMALFGPIPPLKIGSLLVFIGTVYVMWQLHRRGSNLPRPEESGGESVLDYRRRELVRQRDALASVFSWYILPPAPGMLVILATPWLMTPLESWRWPPVDTAMIMSGIIGFFVFVWWINQLAARKLQEEIDRLDALRGE